MAICGPQGPDDRPGGLRQVLSAGRGAAETVPFFWDTIAQVQSAGREAYDTTPRHLATN